MRHHTQLHPPPPQPCSSSAYSSPPSPDSWLKTSSRPIPAFWGEEKNLEPKGVAGPGPRGSHHRRLKTRLAVTMMPRRRTKGSQVFTKAPTLRGEGRIGGKGQVSEPPQAPSIPTQEGLLSPRKLLEPCPHPIIWSTKGLAGPGTHYGGLPPPVLGGDAPGSWWRCDTSLGG